MQNAQIDNAIAWNPWHGCKRASPGCQNCFVYKMDQRYGRNTTVITKGKTTYELNDKDCPPGSLVKLCFASDFFIEDAGEWRGGVNIGKWNLKEQNKKAEEIQHEPERLYE